MNLKKKHKVKNKKRRILLSIFVPGWAMSEAVILGRFKSFFDKY